ncbi:hypothetical protein VP01_1077g10 [Puccinia sorghi]|uniref:DNA helicase Pif1-like 2B domain-containing protein n=1 Tax=Puccinia sorghi TaxID=27349 RepID=A0A0L6VTQ6_9BASI|nr:hypothetical protein VP01_1077g10 [Puccinia sorghi]
MDTSNLIDPMIFEDNASQNHEAIQEELLHCVKFPGFPNYKLILKTNILVILTCNLNLQAGLSNGTQLLIIAIHEKNLLCKILTSSRVGDLVIIPQIQLNQEANHV